jgi:death-on-curing protein
MKRPAWLLNRAVLAAHRRQLAEHGGAPGVDLPRLALALGWPRTVLAFADGRLTLYDLAAAYSEALLRLRPFASGNERMAWLLCRLFLAVNGAPLPAAAEQLAAFGALRRGAIGRGRYGQWLLARRPAVRELTVHTARDGGRVLRIGVLRRPAAAASLPAAAQAQVPLLQD